MPKGHHALESDKETVEGRAVSAATAISAQTMSSPSLPTSVEMRKPMPTMGVPKNSATMAPIMARVELILRALKMKAWRPEGAA